MLLLASTVLAQIDPRYAINVTVYHEGPPKLEALHLINQDTGDDLGDAYFVLRGLMLPVECADKKSPFHHFDCENPEQNSTLNVISQNFVTFDSRYGPYGSCNVDHETGEYACECSTSWHHHQPCGPLVGFADVAKRESRYPIPSTGPDWMYWRDNLATKTGGAWYSTHAPGKCGDSSTGGAAAAGGSNCTWKILSTPRQILAQCLESRVAEAIIKHDSSCFDKCPQPHNASTACVVECYYLNLLGPHGGSRRIAPTEGLPLQIIQDAWSNAFASTDPEKGGCPEADAPESNRPWPLAWSTRAGRGSA